jgi:4-amino-4-deoxy-L-arabinose transferase-like glycosyltransferase
VNRRLAYATLALLAALPRLGVLLHEGDAIVSGLREKSYVFAQVFVESGTYGLIPGEPSAYTQPLYGWFLVPIWWLFGGGWLPIGLAQIALAVVTAWLVYEIGARVLGARAGAIAAAIATLNPYLVWHDVHINREIVDQVCAAGVVLLTLVVAERPSKRLGALLGVASGLAILGNTRLVLIPIVCVGYLAWRLPRARSTAALAALVLAGAAVAVAPWVVRNKVQVGCWAITTDARALWKANNLQTYGLLSSGQWIDNVRRPVRPPEPGHLTPEEARGIYDRTHGRTILRPDECLAMRFYERRVLDYWRDHPGDKAKLMALSEQLLWQPNVIETGSSTGAGTHLDAGRRLVEPTYMWVVYAFAAAGLFLVPRAFAALALLLLAYQSLCAAVFVGATRYRVPWDFLTVLLATAALARAFAWVRERRGGGAPAHTT